MMTESRILSEFAALETVFPGADSMGVSLLITLLSKDLERYLEMHPNMRPVLEEQNKRVSEFLDSIQKVKPINN